MRRAVADLIGRTPGLRAVLGHIQTMTHLYPIERLALERGALVRCDTREKLDIERRRCFLSRIEMRHGRAGLLRGRALMSR